MEEQIRSEVKKLPFFTNVFPTILLPGQHYYWLCCSKNPANLVFAGFFSCHLFGSLRSPSRARTYNNSVNSRVLYH